jgi:hypothetical protein
VEVEEHLMPLLVLLEGLEAVAAAAQQRGVLLQMVALALLDKVLLVAMDQEQILLAAVVVAVREPLVLLARPLEQV